MAYDVFISYSTKNLHIVDWAVKTLHQQGHIHIFAAEYFSAAEPGFESADRTRDSRLRPFYIALEPGSAGV